MPVFGRRIAQDVPYFPDAVYFINYIVLWVFIVGFLSSLILINGSYLELVLKVEFQQLIPRCLYIYIYINIYFEVCALKAFST